MKPGIQNRHRPVWLALVTIVGFGIPAMYLACIHDFLAVSAPINGRVLVVESWIFNRSAMTEAAKRFRQGGYELLICTAAGDAEEPGYAAKAAQRFVELGVDRSRLRTVSQATSGTGRTYGSALAVRDWLRRERPDVRSIDVFTVGVHSRKSLILFSKALSPGVAVGIIAGRESAYANGRWWASRTGWYIVLRNSVGYLQALLQPRPRN